MKLWMFLAVGVGVYIVWRAMSRSGGFMESPSPTFSGSNPLVVGDTGFVPLSQQLRQRFLTSPAPTNPVMTTQEAKRTLGKPAGFR